MGSRRRGTEEGREGIGLSRGFILIVCLVNMVGPGSVEKQEGKGPCGGRC